MALGAIEKYSGLDVNIVPIGVNYSDILNYRSKVMLQIGEPIEVQKYLNDNETHPAKTIQNII